jgi:hypothetical protein
MNQIRNTRLLVYVVLFGLLALATWKVVAGEKHEEPENAQSLDEQVQTLKQDVLALNRELFVLEAELLYPASTQVAVI